MVRDGKRCSTYRCATSHWPRAGLMAAAIWAAASLAVPASAGDAARSASPVAVAAPDKVRPDAAVAPVPPAEAKPDPSGDQQRRVLMLLIMNSVGPVRPFGNLAR
jgi:hypothetical protein